MVRQGQFPTSMVVCRSASDSVSGTGETFALPFYVPGTPLPTVPQLLDGQLSLGPPWKLLARKT